MNYFKKIDKNPYEDLRWNIPEQKRGLVNVVGGNSQSFRTEVKVAEYLGSNYPIEKIGLILPDALKGKLPPLSEIKYLESTETGSFNSAEELTKVLNGADYNILTGDLSKNQVTGQAVASACQHSEKPLLITRDSVDLVAENMRESLLMNNNLVLVASVAQLVKLLRAVYYPKMLLMSQSLVQVAEVLHKFTLSYPVGIVTLHNGQILMIKDGTVKALPLEKSGYSTITMWSGELAAKIAVLNLYNPDNFIKATICALMVAE